jgi:hypothetical protein
MTRSAMEIYQAYLDEGSRQIMTGAFEELAASMVYPQTMETKDCLLHFEGPEQMVDAIASFRDFLTSMGTTDYHRICDTAAFDDGGTMLTGEHTTYIIKGGSFAVEPYRNRMIMRLDGTTWRGAGIAAAVMNKNYTILSPKQLMAARANDR